MRQKEQFFPILSILFILCAAHKTVRAASESLVMNERKVHVVITVNVRAGTS